MKKRVFQGVGTALVTPFKKDKIDFESLEVLINRQLQAHIPALIILGTTGEPATITNSEREMIIKFAKKQIAGKAKLIVGCGSNSTKQTIKLYKKAEELGVDSALIVTPYYNKCTQSGIIEHYKAVSKSGNLPIIAYNVPGRTGVNVLPETLLKLCEIENICGIKEASGNISQILECFKLCRNQLPIYSGDDALNAVFYMLGACGSISVASNAIPEHCLKIYNLAKEKEYESMFILQEKLLPLIKALFLEVNPIPIKATLASMGYCENNLRLPLTPISQEHFSVLKAELSKVLGDTL